jgi:hypothetical protein
MKSSFKRPEPPHFLSGWKDIANYLGKGVRTVQRYERELGLPVRRPARKPWGSVVATKAELDAWVSASPIRGAFLLVRPAVGPSASAASEIRNGVQEMRRLRDQTAALRADLRASIRLLRDSIEGLHGELSQNRSSEILPQILEQSRTLEPRVNDALQLLAIDVKMRKVS